MAQGVYNALHRVECGLPFVTITDCLISDTIKAHYDAIIGPSHVFSMAILPCQQWPSSDIAIGSSQPDLQSC